MQTQSTMIPLTLLATTICEDGSCGCGCGLPLVELSLPQSVAAPSEQQPQAGQDQAGHAWSTDSAR
jgi:hypothetical protein